MTQAPVSSSFKVPVRIDNLAIDPRTDMVTPQRCFALTSIPFDAQAPLLASFTPSSGGSPQLAVKIRTVGKHSTIYAVAGNWINRTSLGTLTAQKGGLEPHFAPSDWVADDMQAVIPAIEISFKTGDRTLLPLTKADLVQETPVSQDFRLTFGPIEGMWATMWVTVFSAQDIVELRGNVRLSDRTTPDWDKQIEGINLVTGEYFAQDFAARSGSSAPVSANGKWNTVITGPMSIGDGQAVTFWGRLLCLPQRAPGGIGSIQTYFQDELLRTTTLLNALIAPVIGTAQSWSNKWLAFGETPRTPAGHDLSYDTFAYEIEARGYLSGGGRITDMRPEGLAPSAGQTGGQYDFGATKGWPAVAGGSPFWAWYGRFHVTEFLRGFMHFESDGTLLRAAAHPDRVSWSMLTNDRVSKDTLGKGPKPYSFGTGWTGMDNQHRSQKLTAGILALTGDPMIQEMIEQAIEEDLARDQSHVDAARAAGRLLMTWADFYLLMPEPVQKKIETCMLNYLKAFKGTWTNQGPIKVTDTMLDDRTGIVDENGKAVECWSVWGHAILSMGFWAAWKVLGLEDFKTIALQAARSVVRGGTFLTPEGSWKVCTYVQALPNGAALPAAAYTLAPIGQARSIVTDGDGWWTWTMPAVLLVGLFGGDELDPDVARAREIVRQRIPNGPTDWNASEWFAVADYTSLLSLTMSPS